LFVSCLNDNAGMTTLWTVKIITFLLWALAAGSATFWILQNVNAGANDSGNANATSAARANAAQEPSLTPQVAAALGAKNSVAPTAAGALTAVQARFQLQGVMAVGTKQGTALISADGKPAKPYRVGSAIEEGLEVTAVAARSASVGSNGRTTFTLALPNKN
jgi:general secretion pathway protein C